MRAMGGSLIEQPQSAGRALLRARAGATVGSLTAALALGILGGLGGASPVERILPVVAIPVAVAIVACAGDSWLFGARPWVSVGFSIQVVSLSAPVVAQLPQLPAAAIVLGGALSYGTITGAALASCSFEPENGSRRLVGLSALTIILTVAWSVTAVDPYDEPACLRTCVSTGAPLADVVPAFSALVVETAGVWTAATLAAAAVLRHHSSTVPATTALFCIAAVSAVPLARVVAWWSTEPTIALLAVPGIAALPLALVCWPRGVREAAARAAVGRIASALNEGRDEDLLDQVQFRVEDGGWIDSTGTLVAEHTDWMLVTRGGEPLARVATANVVTTPALAAVWVLTLENARLLAMTRRRTRELRLEQRRIVRTGDAEARRLERDLHDGAQQRLVSAMFFLSAAAEDGPDAPDTSAAISELRTALAELREISHGPVPATLKEEGVWSTLREAVRRRSFEVEWGVVPAELDDDAGAALFVSVISALDRVDADDLAVVKVEAERDEDRLRATISVPGRRFDTTELTDASDRLGAVGGSLTARPDGRLEVSVPCAS